MNGDGRGLAAIALVCGLVAGAAAGWFVAPHAVEDDLGQLEGHVQQLAFKIDEVDARLAALSKQAADAQSAGADSSHPQVKAVAEDLVSLRDAMRSEFTVVDERLKDLRRRIDEAGAAAPPREGKTPQELEDMWATLSRDPDAGVRFSALTQLGLRQTDRSVQVSVQRLKDEDVKVVWQAVRNLGRFREKDAAPPVAALLDHAESVVRAAAYDALVQMGAPANTGFEASANPEKRRAAADALRKWAAEQ